MIIEPAKIIPHNDYSAVLPIVTLHDGVDQAGDVPHSDSHIVWWMLTLFRRGNQIGDLRKGALLQVLKKLTRCCNVGFGVNLIPFLLVGAPAGNGIPKRLRVGIRLAFNIQKEVECSLSRQERFWSKYLS